jgi:type I site-specific restriction endonuclease
MELREYQCDAVSAIAREFESVRSTLLVLATGLGKTVTFAAVARDVVAGGGRVLVVAHRGELLEQASRTLQRFDLRVGIEQGVQRVDRAELPDVVIASVQTLRGKRLETFDPSTFQLVVIDEAHHATAPSYRSVLDHFEAAKVLGVTATPDRADGIGLRNVFESVAFRYELLAGIRAEHLAPLELRSVVVDSLDLSQVRTLAGDLRADELEREMTRDRVLHEIAGPLAELARGRQTLAFVVGVEQAHALAEVLRGYGVAAAAVDGSMAADQRAQVLADYSAGRVQVVTNAMLWTEGFDAPATSCIALVRPTRSRALVTQMIGRGTRQADGKSSCLVLDFVPGRMARVRLASPADALAGEELPVDIATLVQTGSTGESGRIDDLIAGARAHAEQIALFEIQRQEAAAAERRRRVQSVGVIYEAPRLNIDELLEAVSTQNSGYERQPASLKQVMALRASGLDVPETLSRDDASKLFGVLEARRAAGLCTLKQARKLRCYGLRDDVSFAQARTLLDTIAANGWKAPGTLLRDQQLRAVPVAPLA